MSDTSTPRAAPARSSGWSLAAQPCVHIAGAYAPDSIGAEPRSGGAVLIRKLVAAEQHD